MYRFIWTLPAPVKGTTFYFLQINGDISCETYEGFVDFLTAEEIGQEMGGN